MQYYWMTFAASEWDTFAAADWDIFLVDAPVPGATCGFIGGDVTGGGIIGG